MKKTSPMDSILFLAPFGMMAETAQRLASDLGISLKVEVADDDHAIETVARATLRSMWSSVAAVSPSGSKRSTISA